MHADIRVSLCGALPRSPPRACFPLHGRFGVHSATNLLLLTYLSPCVTITSAQRTGIEKVAGVIFQTGLKGFVKVSLHERQNIPRRCFRVNNVALETETADRRR